MSRTRPSGASAGHRRREAAAPVGQGGPGRRGRRRDRRLRRARPGARAEASAAFWPTKRPSAAAADVERRQPPHAALLRDQGEAPLSAGEAEGLRRRQLSIAQFGNHAQRIRSIGLLHDPCAGPPAPAAFQFQAPARRARGRARPVRGRWARRRPSIASPPPILPAPASPRAAEGPAADDEAGGPAPLAGQLQATPGGEIDVLRLADHRGDAGGGQGVLERRQGLGLVAGADLDQPLRRESRGLPARGRRDRPAAAPRPPRPCPRGARPSAPPSRPPRPPSPAPSLRPSAHASGRGAGRLPVGRRRSGHRRTAPRPAPARRLQGSQRAAHRR